MSISRRGFIAGLAATPVAFRPEIGAATAPVRGFIAESGKRGAWPLVVGLLATSRPDAHELQIEILRRLHRYPRTLRYMSTDRNKAAFASALIDSFAGADDLTFTALVVHDGDRKWQEIGDGKDAAYAAIYRNLVERAGAREMVIRLPERNANRRDNALRATLAGGMNLDTRSGGRSGLMELAAFLSGCVYGTTTGVGNGMKRALAEQLHRRASESSRFAVESIAV